MCRTCLRNMIWTVSDEAEEWAETDEEQKILFTWCDIIGKLSTNTATAFTCRGVQNFYLFFFLLVVARVLVVFLAELICWLHSKKRSLPCSSHWQLDPAGAKTQYKKTRHDTNETIQERNYKMNEWFNNKLVQIRKTVSNIMKKIFWYFWKQLPRECLINALNVNVISHIC